jgi:hypothetical protein
MFVRECICFQFNVKCFVYKIICRVKKTYTTQHFLVERLKKKHTSRTCNIFQSCSDFYAQKYRQVLITFVTVIAVLEANYSSSHSLLPQKRNYICDDGYKVETRDFWEVLEQGG